MEAHKTIYWQLQPAELVITRLIIVVSDGVEQLQVSSSGTAGIFCGQKASVQRVLQWLLDTAWGLC